MQEQTEQGNSLAVILAWIVVLIPLSWGFYNTALNAVKLFK